MIVITPSRLTTKIDANEASMLQRRFLFISRSRFGSHIRNGQFSGRQLTLSVSSHFVRSKFNVSLSPLFYLVLFSFYYSFVLIFHSFFVLPVFLFFFFSAFFLLFFSFFLYEQARVHRRRMHKTSVRGGRTKAF